MSKSQDQTVTQKSEIPQYIEDQAKQNIQTANTIAGTPYTPYTGQRLADFTPQQLQAWGNTQAQMGEAQSIQDYARSTGERLTGFQSGAVGADTVGANQVMAERMQAANAGSASAAIAQVSPAELARARADAASSGYATATGGQTSAASMAAAQAKAEQTRASQISEFYDPYTQSVIDTTMQQLGRENTILQNDNNSAAAKAGAFGGGRHGVVAAETNRGYLDTAARTTAGLNAANYAQALAAAQQNTGLRQQTTLQNSAQAQEANRTNATFQQNTNDLNAQLSQQLGIANAGMQQQSLLTNAGFQQQANMSNSQNALQVALANANMRQQGSQFNASNQQQSLLANAGWQQQAGLANQQTNLQGQLANQGANLQAAQGNQNANLAAAQGNQTAALNAAGLNLNAANMMQSLASQRQQLNATDAAQLEAIGAAQQQQTQRGLDIGYEDFLRQQQYPIDMLNLQNATIAGQPYSTSSSTTQPITQNWGSAALGGGLAGLQIASGLGFTGASAGIGAGLGALLPLLGASDRRLKKDIQKMGKDEASGLPMYAYRYKTDPRTSPKVVGPMAQDVEKKFPGTTQMVGDRMAINYTELSRRTDISGFRPPNPLAGRFDKAA